MSTLNTDSRTVGTGVSTFVIYLDSYVAGDPIAVQQIARALVSWHSNGLSAVVVHDPRESIARLFEGWGRELEAGWNVECSSIDERLAVERLVREENSRLVATATEAGLPAVGLQGSDRGVLKVTNSGQVEISNDEWVFDLARRGGVPFVSPLLTSSAGGPILADPVVIVRGLVASGDRNRANGDALETSQDPSRTGTVAALVFARKNLVETSSYSVFDDSGKAQISADLVAEKDEIAQLLEEIRVFLTLPRHLSAPAIVGKWLKTGD